MGEGAQIFRRTSRAEVKQTDEISNIGQAVKQYLEQIAPKQQAYSAVVDIWNELLPAGLDEHCRLDEITSGVITVIVDSPVYKYELELCSSHLLKELQERCSIRLKKIKFCISVN